MSQRETPLTRDYWRTVGGLLVEEFEVVRRTPTAGARRVDAVILSGQEARIADPGEDISLEGEDVIVVQTKATRLGMYLMGQALFSAELVKAFNPASIRSVALCTKDDSVLRPLLDPYPNVEVVVMNHPTAGLAESG